MASFLPFLTPSLDGATKTMMGYSGMGGVMGHPAWGIIFWLVVVIDLMLLGIWLFQKVTKK